KLLFTLTTPFTCCARDAAWARCVSVSTTPLKFTTPRSVSTLIRGKFESRSLVNFVCTAVEIDASLIVWPAVFPVVDWQPVRATRKVRKVHDMTPTPLESENIQPPS